MEIRTAKPNDKGNVDELMYSSGIELYDFIFNTSDKSAVEFIRYEFNSGQGFCGYNNVTVAIRDDTVIATGCFYDGNIFNQLTYGTLKNIFGFYGFFKAWPVLARTRHIGRIMRTPRKNEIYLSNLGVSPECQGTGIGSKLMEHKRLKAKEDGYKYLSLDVADNNPRAESLYKRLGFTVLREKVAPITGKGIPNAKEMIMEL